MRKLIICGDGRAGKDTVADVLVKFFSSTNQREISSISSSWAARGYVWRTAFGGELGLYSNSAKCWEDRVNFREVWKQSIVELNQNDPTTLANKIFVLGDIYVGCRAKREFDAIQTKYLHSILSLYVTKKDNPSDPTNEITPDMCDYVIHNDGDIIDLTLSVITHKAAAWLGNRIVTLGV